MNDQNNNDNSSRNNNHRVAGQSNGQPQRPRPNNSNNSNNQHQRSHSNNSSSNQNNRPDGRQDNRPNNRQDNRPNNRQDNRSNNRQENRPNNRMNQSENRGRDFNQQGPNQKLDQKNTQRNGPRFDSRNNSRNTPQDHQKRDFKRDPRRDAKRRKRRVAVRTLSSGALLKRYGQLWEQHELARRQYYEQFFRVEENKKRLLEDQFVNSILSLRKFESSMEDWQRRFIADHFVHYEDDNEYTSKNSIPVTGTIEVVLEPGQRFEDPHLLNTQKQRESYRTDQEQTVGGPEDLEKYLAQKSR
jgi:hypothetical protein